MATAWWPLCATAWPIKPYRIRAKYMIGADGARSVIAEQLGLPMEGEMGLEGSMNIEFEADLSKYVAHRPSVLYWIFQPGSNIGGIGGRCGAHGPTLEQVAVDLRL